MCFPQMLFLDECQVKFVMTILDQLEGKKVISEGNITNCHMVHIWKFITGRSHEV